jgi:hypothetical protein
MNELLHIFFTINASLSDTLDVNEALQKFKNRFNKNRPNSCLLDHFNSNKYHTVNIDSCTIEKRDFKYIINFSFWMDNNESLIKSEKHLYKSLHYIALQIGKEFSECFSETKGSTLPHIWNITADYTNMNYFWKNENERRRMLVYVDEHNSDYRKSYDSRVTIKFIRENKAEPYNYDKFVKVLKDNLGENILALHEINFSENELVIDVHYKYSTPDEAVAVIYTIFKHKLKYPKSDITLMKVLSPMLYHKYGIFQFDKVFDNEVLSKVMDHSPVKLSLAEINHNLLNIK